MQITEKAKEALKAQAECYRRESIADSTKRSRAGQWGIYKKACLEFDWPILPCSLEQACLYVTYLAVKLKFSSVKAYYQAVIFNHVCAGLEPVRMSNPVLKATLKGIEKSKSGDSKGKDPILPHHLKRLMSLGNFNVELEMIVCTAALFMFRTLLRVSNIVHSSHTLRRGDVVFGHEGCFVRVRSSKTTSKRDSATIMPVLFSSDKSICSATWLAAMCKKFNNPKEAFLFSSPNIPVLTYSMFSRKFKELTIRAGLQGDFASHSLRRGGATFMSILERPVDQIKARGLWKSDCVFRYIAPPLSAKISNEKEVAKFC